MFCAACGRLLLVFCAARGRLLPVLRDPRRQGEAAPRPCLRQQQSAGRALATSVHVCREQVARAAGEVAERGARARRLGSAHDGARCLRSRLSGGARRGTERARGSAESERSPGCDEAVDEQNKRHQRVESHDCV